MWRNFTLRIRGKRVPTHDEEEGYDDADDEVDHDGVIHPDANANGRPRIKAKRMKASDVHIKHHPKVAGGGENLPLEILRSLSEWIGVLEERGAVGAGLGGMLGCVQGLEDSLSGM